MAWEELGGANTGLPGPPPNSIDERIHWLGTTNNDPLIIRTENGPLGPNNAPNPAAEVMRITPVDPAVLPGTTQPRSVGIGTVQPKAKLHVNLSESRYPSIHAGGSSAALSFASQTYQDFLPDGAYGNRWEWYATSDGGAHSSARLWSGLDKLFVTNWGQVLLPGGRSPTNVFFPEVPIGTLTPRVPLPPPPPSVPTPGELVLGGIRTSIRGFDGPLEDTTKQEGFALRTGYHWIRTNGNEAELWMAFARTGYWGPFLQRSLRAAVSWVGPGFSVTSDARTKTNVRQVEGALEKLERVRGVAFEWAEAEWPYALGGVAGQPSLGVVAQEVEEVFPEVVSIYDADQEYRAVDYNGLTSVLIEAVKELKAENEALRSRIEALEGAQK